MIRSLLTHLTLLVLFASATIAADAPNTLTEAEKSAGWKLLFDGKTNAGWVGVGKTEFPPKGWSVVNGVLLHTDDAGGGDIVTSEQYDDFELSWEWKIGPGGNSGIKYNLAEPTKATGFEYQLMDDANHADGKRGSHQTGGLYDLLEPTGKSLKPIGEWNHSRILVNGNHVEHWLNGVKTATFEIGSPELKTAIAKSKYKAQPRFGEKAKSPILIQDHGDEVAIRSMKLRVLPGK
jgi:hypothetical protein